MLHNPSHVVERATAADAAAPAPIVALPTAVTAFIGRTLKGSLDTPTPIDSFAEYQRLFGGLWQPAPLSYAVEQFFDNGGQQAGGILVADGKVISNRTCAQAKRENCFIAANDAMTGKLVWKFFTTAAVMSRTRARF